MPAQRCCEEQSVSPGHTDCSCCRAAGWLLTWETSANPTAASADRHRGLGVRYSTPASIRWVISRIFGSNSRLPSLAVTLSVCPCYSTPCFRSLPPITTLRLSTSSCVFRSPAHSAKTSRSLLYQVRWLQLLSTHHSRVLYAYAQKEKHFAAKGTVS